MKQEKQTLTEVLDRAWEGRTPNQVMVSTKRKGTWVELSTQTFRERIRHTAFGLYDAGIRPGDRVSLHSRNSAEWLICDLALQQLGAVTVPIYTTQPGKQIEHILRDSESKLHIVENDSLFAETKPLIKSISTIKGIVSIEKSTHSSIQTLRDIEAKGKETEADNEQSVRSILETITPETLATLIYTSGTTGMPKGVMLSHGNLAFNVQASMERVPFRLDEVPGKRFLSYLPLSHVFERMISYMYLLMGVSIWYIEEIDEIREDLQTVRPAFFATVPRLLEKLQNGMKARGQEMSGVQKRLYYWALKLASRYDPSEKGSIVEQWQRRIADSLVYRKIRAQLGGELIGVVSGGAPLSEEIFRFINGIGLYCGQGYGLTETSPVIAVQDPNHLKPGSCGLPLRGVEVKIADDGEICVRGANVMMGYYRDPERTNDVLGSDGWLKTGDIGELDEDGELYVKDRKKDLFKLSTGKYVAPQFIETQLINSPFIEQAVVLGYHQKFCSALIVPHWENVGNRLDRRGLSVKDPDGESPEVRTVIEEEIEKVNKTLSPWETVKKFKLLEKMLTIEDGELTPTLKLKRSVIHERYKEQIDAIYQDDELS
ncbi:MAG: long-chain fatty acid--CoA ligase [Balneolaceae bacterium]